MDCTAKCTILKNNEIINEFKQPVTFPDGTLANYGDIVKKLQAEVNQALTNLVNEENSLRTDDKVTSQKKDNAGGDDGAQEGEDENVDDDGSGDMKATEIPRSPKHKIISDSLGPDSPPKRPKTI